MPSNSSSFFLYRGQPMGFQYELAQKLAASLGVRLDAVAPVRQARMLRHLERGRVDVVAAVLAQTQQQIGTKAKITATDSREVNRRVFEDATVNTASTCGVAGVDTLFEDKKFFWTITNTSASPLTIGSMSIAWPSVNGTLKKIRLDGSDIWTVGAQPPYLQIVDDWHDDASRRVLAAGQSAEFKFEFDDYIDWAEANYTIYLDFQEGCTFEFTPRVMDCRANGLDWREFKDKKIQWRLPNVGTEPITVSVTSTGMSCGSTATPPRRATSTSRAWAR